MSAATSIEWTDRTWNPVTGCTKVSQGCKHCYAEGVAERFWGSQYGQVAVGPTLPDGGPTAWRARRFTDVQTHDDRLFEPLRWRKGARVFVNSMSDLFHEDVPDEFIDRVFAVMAFARHHTFQVLTKRPERMRAYLTEPRRQRVVDAGEAWTPSRPPAHWYHISDWSCRTSPWPLPNVWLGVSVEDQVTADLRIPQLLDTPAAIRFVSAEPLLSGIDVRRWMRCYTSARTGGSVGPVEITERPGFDWLIVGGESGPHARPFALEWASSLVDQVRCSMGGTQLFVKQLGAYVVSEQRAAANEAEMRAILGPDTTWPTHRWLWRAGLKNRKGGDPAEWPTHLQVREFPEVRS